ncbi:Putative tRNA pseudouridine synthase [Apostasia shenzhenica]|uniref:tRNA pseudouridine synthase n=1 Tax=Apostasia shenzhenica TaxID=1088818 RepID=A0A2I0AX49_9ASPA|nr:Putative tRNA pseudouridine synthase [Apostasia shenzhenica]
MASPPPSSPQSKKLKMSTTTNSSGDEAEPIPGCLPAGGSAEPKPRRYKRRKIAIFLAYCGAGYQGMQKNPGARTIESDLEEALFHAGAVPEHDRGNPKRYDWARAARTDKGVSAAGQVVSGRFYIDPPGLVERLNSILSDQIRIFGFKRVTASFNAKKFCDRRRYVYLLPVFALDPNAHPDRESVVASLGSDNELVRCVECSERGRKAVGLFGRQSRALKDSESEGGASVEVDASPELLQNPDLADEGKSEVGEDKEDDTISNQGTDTKMESANEAARSDEMEVPIAEETTKAEEQSAKTEPHVRDGANGATGKFCYGDKEREMFNRILRRYVGTHNFHNFTTRTKAEDPSARRYIISFNADHVVNIEGIEYVKCEVIGQSFMLHQIRKMIGLAVALMRNCAPESLMDIALRQDVSINVPTAPEVGLFLDECLFSSYNQKWKDSHEALTMEAYAEEAEDFKMKYILSHIASMEHKEGAVALWLHSLNHRNYPDFQMKDPNGEHTIVEPEPSQMENSAT